MIGKINDGGPEFPQRIDEIGTFRKCYACGDEVKKGYAVCQECFDDIADSAFPYGEKRAFGAS